MKIKNIEIAKVVEYTLKDRFHFVEDFDTDKIRFEDILNDLDQSRKDEKAEMSADDLTNIIDNFIQGYE
jgi:hypothetical protein